MSRTSRRPSENRHSTRSTRRVHSGQPKPTIITNGVDLFTWAWRHLEGLEPRVAVNEGLVGCLDELFQTIRAGLSIPYPPVEWTVIFVDIRWDNIDDRTGDHCSRSLLAAVGQVCATLIGEGGGRLPPIRAAEMLLQRYDMRQEYVGYEESSSGTFLVSTAACEREFGARIRVMLTDEPLDELIWTLEGTPILD